MKAIATYTDRQGRRHDITRIEPSDMPGCLRCTTHSGQTLLINRDMESLGRLKRLNGALEVEP